MKMRKIAFFWLIVLFADVHCAVLTSMKTSNVSEKLGILSTTISNNDKPTTNLSRKVESGFVPPASSSVQSQKSEAASLNSTRNAPSAEIGLFVRADPNSHQESVRSTALRKNDTGNYLLEHIRKFVDEGFSTRNFEGVRRKTRRLRGGTPHVEAAVMNGFQFANDHHQGEMNHHFYDNPVYNSSNRHSPYCQSFGGCGGWQPRWFVLDNGILAYYKSQEEVNQGCKGSIKMSVCEIVVNPADNTRLDLVIPSEQHFYLKAATPQERQQWLVALGSAKASRMSARQKTESTSSNPDTLKTKKSELRLYCDLLMQQVHTVKSAAPDSNHSDLQTLTEATSLLGATCDTFIKTLEECMRLANANFPYELPHQLITDSALPPALASSNAAFKKANRSPIYRSNSADRNGFPSVHSKSCYRLRKDGMSDCCYSDPYSSDSSSQISDGDLAMLVKRENWDVPITSSPVQQTAGNGISETHSVASGSTNGVAEAEVNGGSDDEECVWTEASDNENNNRDLPVEQKEVQRVNDPGLETFFSNIPVSFLNLKVQDDDLIPTSHFLESCAIVITVFDMFGSPIFAPMKMDVMGNLKKITDKYNQDTKQFFALQNIVQQEMATNTTTARNSATDALLWLKRGLEFTYEFLMEFSRGNPDLKNCTLMAYNRTLKQYHGWIVRGVISAATRTVPSRNEVLGKLALHPDDMANPKYEEELKADAKRFIKAMDRIVKILNDFYQHHNLDKKEVV